MSDDEPRFYVTDDRDFGRPNIAVRDRRWQEDDGMDRVAATFNAEYDEWPYLAADDLCAALNRGLGPFRLTQTEASP